MINRLYEKAKNGEKEAEPQLFSLLTERFGYFLQYKVRDDDDREDIIQETLKAIAAKYMTVELEVKFSSWAYGALEKSVLHYFRTKANRQKRETAPEASAVGRSNLTLDPDLKLRLEDCFRKLCQTYQRYARVLNLSYNGYNIEEVSAKLNLTKNNVYIILSRGRGLLKNCLKTGALK